MKSVLRTALRSFAAITLGIVAISCSELPSSSPNLSFTKLTTGTQADTSTEYIMWKTPSDRLAQLIPKFSGIYVDEGKFVMFLQGDGGTTQETTQATAALKFVLDSLQRKYTEVVFKPGKYSFTQFRIWELRLSRVYHTHGIHQAGLSEQKQSIQAYVRTQTQRESLLSDLGRLGIPDDAITVVVQEPAQAANVNNHQRPLFGGIKVTHRYGPSSGSINTCTLGYPVGEFIPDVQPSPEIHFRYLVSSHCNQGQGVNWGGYTGQNIYQPVQTIANGIGKNIRNPAPLSGVPGCGTGHVCRKSDAAIMSTSVSTHLRIARTTYFGDGPHMTGSQALDQVNGPFWGVSGYTTAFEGDTVHKVGHATGWTKGRVQSNCMYVHMPLPAGDNGGRLCSVMVAAGAKAGDSGAPVWVRESSLSVSAVGLLFGVYIPPGQTVSFVYYYSPMTSIIDELRPPGWAWDL